MVSYLFAPFAFADVSLMMPRHVRSSMITV